MFWIFHINRIIQCVTFCEWLLSLLRVFKVNPLYSMYQYFIPFYDLIIFHCIDNTKISLFISWCIFDCFHLWLLWIVLPMNMCVYIFEYLFSILWRYKPRSGISGWWGILCLTFWGTTVAEPFDIPTRNVWGFQFLYILTNPGNSPFKKF